MPIKVWERHEHGFVTSHIETSWPTRLGGEEYRTEAEALDTQIDKVLDRAYDLASTRPVRPVKSGEFVKRWAIGRAIMESGVLDSPYLASEERSHLWLALARKCRLGNRSSGEIENKWQTLIPERELEPKRLKRDIFARSLWLQEQEREDALATFGGSLTNAREIHNRETLRSTKLRNSLGRWFLGLEPSERTRLQLTKEFIRIAKTLQKRWPSRGPGSARRPAHYTDQDLDREVRRALTDFATTGSPSCDPAQ